jgi:hypothetical protein
MTKREQEHYEIAHTFGSGPGIHSLRVHEPLSAGIPLIGHLARCSPATIASI